jgi:hypothetical protein
MPASPSVSKSSNRFSGRFGPIEGHTPAFCHQALRIVKIRGVMALKEFVALFLTISFVLHGIAFTILGTWRRKTYYFFLTGTFTFLTAIYIMKFESLAPEVPGTKFPVSWLLRLGASVCTLTYLSIIYKVEDSWLWKLRHRKSRRNGRVDSQGRKHI